LYKDLRFEDVGLENFTDPAITGGTPTPREQLEPQIDQALTDMGQWVSATDESQYASAFLDLMGLYSITPNVVVAVSLGLGVLSALAAVTLLGGTGHRLGGAVLRTARTSRTGGALGVTAGLGSTALTAAGAVALMVLIATVISVLAAGVPGLALALLVHAGLGALIVVAAHAGSLLASTLADRPETEPTLRTAVAGAGTRPRAALLLGGVGLGVTTVLLVTSALLDGARRLGANAVVETRASMLEGRARAELVDLIEMVRRAAVPPVVVAVLMPVVAGFGIGPGALPGLVVGVVLTAAGLGLWTLGAGSTL